MPTNSRARKKSQGIKVNKLGAKRPASYVRKPLSDRDLQILEMATKRISRRGIARILNIAEGTVRNVLIQEEKLLTEMATAKVTALATLQAEKEMGMLEVLDEEVMQMAVYGEGKGKTGRARACNLGYQRLGLIDAPGAKVVQQTSTSASNTTAGTSFEVYESAWLKDRKANWAKQLEQKYAPPSTPTA